MTHYPRHLLLLLYLVVDAIGLPSVSLGNGLVPFKTLQGAATQDIGSLQVKLSDMTPTFKPNPSLLITLTQNVPNADIRLFKPFRRAGHSYSNDESRPTIIGVSRSSLEALFEELSDRPGITDGGADSAAILSFALLVATKDSSIVFESLLDRWNADELFRALRRTLAENDSEALNIVNTWGRRISIMPDDVAACVAIDDSSSVTMRVVPYPIREHSLPNGLRVVFVNTQDEGVAAYYTLVLTGSRNEIERGHSGFAHLFEHMMFRGTKKYSSEARDTALMRMGVTDNAFTTDDVTIYTNYAPSSGLAKLIEIEADRFQNLEYDEAAFQTETKAVLGEYNKNFADPSQKMDELLRDLAFTTHTYKHTTMGSLEDIKAMPTMYEYSKSFFRRWYRPDNCVIFVAGGFDADATLAQIEKHYGPWGGTTAKIEIPVEPPQTAEKRLHHEWDTPTQPRVMVAYHTPGAAAGLKNCALQNVLTTYLIGETSPAYKTLVLDKQLVELIEPWYADHRDANLWTYNLVLKDQGRTTEAVAVIDASIQDLAAGKVDEKRFRDAQSNFRYGVSMYMETPADIAVQLALYTGLTGDVKALDRLAGEVMALKSSDLTDFARANLSVSNRTMVTLATMEEEMQQ